MNVRSSSALRMLLLAFVVLALVACGRSVTRSSNDPSNLESWVAEVRQRPAPALEPLPVMQQFETFEYAAQGMRDPFTAAFANAGGSGPRPDANRPRQTLEGFPLDSLVMVGTLGSGSGVVGLVMAPDKVTYRIRPGAYMGQSDGRVVAVREDKIDLVELVPDGAGGWLERQASVLMKEQ